MSQALNQIAPAFSDALRRWPEATNLQQHYNDICLIYESNGSSVIEQAKYELSEDKRKDLLSHKNITQLYSSLEEIGDDEEKEILGQIHSDLKNKIIDNSFDNWGNRLEEFIAKEYLKPRLPKFCYFDDYYNLPGRINLSLLNSQGKDPLLNDEENETAKALMELAGVNLDDLVNSDNFEEYISELEATSNEITDQIFKYWSTNKNLEIVFAIDTVKNASNIIEKILDIRVKNNKHRITLPLQNRSKGFNWFFSFAVWFSRLQTEEEGSIILLLDEPGLNLHAKAQKDLLSYIEDLSKDYQVIYSTHSPFMVDSTKLHRVRTVYDGDKTSTISESIQEKDPDTLFPLQAALGYDLAQNLFIGKNNLLVEGPADLIYLTYFSDLLKENSREGLNESITITPVGGMDKVSTFISLFRGSKLNIITLLDSFTDQKGKQKVDDMIRNKIIREKNVLFFHDFVTLSSKKADIEDLFDKEDYLKIFNLAFETKYETKDLDNSKNILPELNRLQNVKRFNHYSPARKMIVSVVNSFSSQTLDNFESVFKKINTLF